VGGGGWWGSEYKNYKIGGGYTIPTVPNPKEKNRLNINKGKQKLLGIILMCTHAVLPLVECYLPLSRCRRPPVCYYSFAVLVLLLLNEIQIFFGKRRTNPDREHHPRNTRKGNVESSGTYRLTISTTHLLKSVLEKRTVEGGGGHRT
jgi:hypothetical protein